MNVQELIYSAKCCDLKDCNDCPSRSRTACRERTMQGLACEVERLQRMVVRESVEMADALRDLFTVCETPDPAIRLRKAEKWRQWMMNEGNGRK